MKLEVTLKDPDAIYEAVENALEDENFGLTDEEEIEVLKEKRKEKLMSFCGQWAEYGEYFTIVFDTEEKTATVKKLNQ